MALCRFCRDGRGRERGRGGGRRREVGRTTEHLVGQTQSTLEEVEQAMPARLQETRQEYRKLITVAFIVILLTQTKPTSYD